MGAFTSLGVATALVIWVTWLQIQPGAPALGGHCGLAQFQHLGPGARCRQLLE